MAVGANQPRRLGRARRLLLVAEAVCARYAACMMHRMPPSAKPWILLFSVVDRIDSSPAGRPDRVLVLAYFNAPRALSLVVRVSVPCFIQRSGAQNTA